MKIVTLISDFGSNNWFVAALKGVILNTAPDTTIVDVTHNADSNQIDDAAFILFSYYRCFPAKTIHLAAIDTAQCELSRQILIKSNRYFFLGPDNGIFSYIYEFDHDIEIYELKNRDFFMANISKTFLARDVLAPVVAHLLNGTPAIDFGPLVTDPVKFEIPKPKIEGNKIYGEIIFIDKFGNLITNITKKDIAPNIEVKFINKNIIISGLKYSYGGAAKNEPLLLIGSEGLLEISINQGNAAEKFKIKKRDKILVINR